MATTTPWIKALLGVVKKNAPYFKRNKELLDIYGGDLLKYVQQALAAQLKTEAYKAASERIPPINVLSRIIAKQSQIYTPGVSRQVVGGNDADSGLLGWYEEQTHPSLRMQLSNEYFNLFKNSLIWPCLGRDGQPKLRVMPSERFVPYSFDRETEAEPEGVIVCLGEMAIGGKCVEVYQQADDVRVTFFTETGADVTAMFSPDPTGLHTLGRKPFTYINRDPNNIVPTPDTDILAMTKLIPILLTDINFAHMFQAFAILVAIDAQADNLTFSPNAVWQFKTPPGSDKQPSITTIQPSADIGGGLELVANQFALWLNTKGIKPGAIGDVNGSNFASGIAKILDEMDTSENRNAQVPYFQQAETDLWDLVLRCYHPIWSADPNFEGPRDTFSPNAKVVANFAEQVPLIRRGQVVADAKSEVEAGYSTDRRALKRINPTFTESEITALEDEIAAEAAGAAAAAQSLNGAQVGSIVDVLGKVALGVMPVESAKALLASAFGLSADAVDAIVNPIKPGSVSLEVFAASK